jgi:hypothetical protein
MDKSAKIPANWRQGVSDRYSHRLRFCIKLIQRSFSPAIATRRVNRERGKRRSDWRASNRQKPRHRGYRRSGDRASQTQGALLLDRRVGDCAGAGEGPWKGWENGQYGSQIDLVILGKLGYLPFSPYGGALLFHFLIKLYECRSVVITTHLSFSEWAQVLGDTKMTTALLDRLTHPCHILDPSNDSYRFKARSETARKTTKEAATLAKA